MKCYDYIQEAGREECTVDFHPVCCDGPTVCYEKARLCSEAEAFPQRAEKLLSLSGTDLFPSSVVHCYSLHILMVIARRAKRRIASVTYSGMAARAEGRQRRKVAGRSHSDVVLKKLERASLGFHATRALLTTAESLLLHASSSNSSPADHRPCCAHNFQHHYRLALQLH